MQLNPQNFRKLSDSKETSIVVSEKRSISLLRQDEKTAIDDISQLERKIEDYKTSQQQDRKSLAELNKILVQKMDLLLKNKVFKMDNKGLYIISLEDRECMKYLMYKVFNNSWDNVRVYFAQVGATGLTAKAIKKYKPVCAILDYRSAVVIEALQTIKPEADSILKNSALELLKELEIDPKDARHKTFMDSLEYLKWNNLGSMKIDSDIDMVLIGDSTEPAVQLFNQLFRNKASISTGFEAGIAFDANVYGKNFVMDITDDDKESLSVHTIEGFLEKKLREGNDSSALNTEYKKFLAKHSESKETKITSKMYETFFADLKETQYYKSHNSEYETLIKEYNQFVKASKTRDTRYVDTSRNKKISDAVLLNLGKYVQLDRDSQEIASLTKARRYMSVKEWDDFKEELIKKIADTKGAVDDKIQKSIEDKLLKAEIDYYKYIARLSVELKLSEKMVLSDKHKFPEAPYEMLEIIELSDLKNFRENVGIKDLRKLMEPYANFLCKVDANERMRAENKIYEEMLSGTMKQRLRLKAIRAGLCVESKERSEYDIRQKVSEYSQYSNEAYFTEGAIRHVVIDKQQLSRGVEKDKAVKQKYAKINLTAEQCLHSMNEQLGDFYKESGRHLEHYPQEGFEGAVLKASKYLHRLANATHHIYECIEFKDEEKVLPKARRSLFTKLEEIKKNEDIVFSDKRGLTKRQLISFDSRMYSAQIIINSDHSTSNATPEATDPQKLQNLKKIIIDITTTAYVEYLKSIQGHSQ